MLCSTWLVTDFRCRSHILVVNPLLNSNDGLVGVLLIFEHCCTISTGIKRMDSGFDLQKASSSNVLPEVSGYMK